MNSPLRIEDLLAHGPWVRGLARAMLRDEGLADDVVQDTWMAALRHPPAQEGSLQGWLGQIARRLVLGRQRAARRRASRETAAARTATVPAVDDAAQKLELHRRLVDAVLSLDEPYRTIVVLRFFEDLAPREIAIKLALPVTTVRNRLQRAVEKLRRVFDDTYGDRKTWAILLTGLGGLPSATAATFAVPAATVALILLCGAFLIARSSEYEEPRAEASATMRRSASSDRTSIPREGAAIARAPFAEPEPPARRNAVFVVRTPEGAPMAGARLAVAREPAVDAYSRAALHFADGVNEGEAVTDVDGRARMEIGDDATRIVAEATGRIPAVVPLEGLDFAREHDVYLDPAETAFAVVVDESGVPVEGAEVRITYERLETAGAGPYFESAALTTNDGSFTVALPEAPRIGDRRADATAALPPRILARAYVRKPGYADVGGELFFDRPADDRGRTVFELRKGRTIAFEFLDEDDRPPLPPPAFLVRVGRDQRGRTAVADEDGRAIVADLANEGRVRIALDDPRYVAVVHPTADPAAARLGFASYALPADEEPLTVRVRRAPELRGVVRDEAGLPVGGVVVRAWPDATWIATTARLRSTTTSADGRFRLTGLADLRSEIECGDFEFAVLPRSFDGLAGPESLPPGGPARIAASRGGAGRFTVASGGPPGVELAVIVRRATPCIGQVVDESGLPVVGAEVVAVDAWESRRGRPAPMRTPPPSARTDSNGEFRLPIASASESALIRITAPGRPRIEVAAALGFEPGVASQRFVAPGGYPFRARVVDEDGLPVRHLALAVASIRGGRRDAPDEAVRIRTDDQGRAEWPEAPAAELSVRPEDPTGRGFRRSTELDDRFVHDPAHPLEARIVLKRIRLLAVEARLRDGTPAALGLVVLTPEIPDERDWLAAEERFGPLLRDSASDRRRMLEASAVRAHLDRSGVGVLALPDDRIYVVDRVERSVRGAGGLASSALRPVDAPPRAVAGGLPLIFTVAP